MVGAWKAIDLGTECGNRGILYWFLILALLFIGGCASGPDISTQMQSAYLGSKQDITPNEKIAILIPSKNLTLRMAIEKYAVNRFTEKGVQCCSLTRFIQINHSSDPIHLWADLGEQGVDGILIFNIGERKWEKTYIPGSGGSYLFSLPYQGKRSGYGIYGGSSYREGHYKSWVSVKCHIDLCRSADFKVIWTANSFTSVKRVKENAVKETMEAIAEKTLDRLRDDGILE